jgi:hypothetical protein
MATITNHSKFTFAVLAMEFTGFVAAGKTEAVPDDVARTWSARADVQAFIDAGTLVVRFDDKADKPDAASALGGLTVKKVVALVNEEDDLDALAELHASETRKTVLKAIEARMAALR